MNAIEIKDLTFGYTQDKTVINHLNLAIKQGEYTTLVGHNGSGKSTLAKLFIGLLEPACGEIRVFDKVLSLETIDEIRQEIGIVFQNPDNQFIGSTVEDDIAFGLENHCVPQPSMQQIINEFAAKVGMSDFLRNEPTRLSGGQKQRVAIAGVLAMQPKIIIFDESTSMLDPKGKKEINDVILELKKQKDLTIISITHDMNEIASSDRTIVLKSGNVFYDGSPKELLKDTNRLIEASLQVPFISQIKNELDKHGITIEHDNMEGVVDELCQLYLNK